MTAIFTVILAIVAVVIIEARRYQYCIDNCHYSQSLDSPVVISEKCNQTKSDMLCQVGFKIDYTRRTLQVKFGSGMDYDRRRSIEQNSDKYDYVIETTTINSTQLTTEFFYSCTLDNRCEETYLLNHVPKLAKKDYTDLQNTLMDVLTTSVSSPLNCNHGLTPRLVECNGTCSGGRNQRINPRTGGMVTVYDEPSCDAEKVSPNVKIYASKVPVTDSEMLGRQITFQCSQTFCNDPEMIDRVEEIVNKKYVAFYQK